MPPTEEPGAWSWTATRGSGPCWRERSWPRPSSPSPFCRRSGAGGIEWPPVPGTTAHPDTTYAPDEPSATDDGGVWRPGFFTADRVHHVRPTQQARLPVLLDGHRMVLGLADCGALCPPPSSPESMRRPLPRCPLCTRKELTP